MVESFLATTSFHPRYGLWRAMTVSDQLSTLAVPFSILLISFLAFSSQVLFAYVQPSSLSRREALVFNALVCSIFICYARCCLDDPGYVPPDWQSLVSLQPARELDASQPDRQRWCRKCDRAKPPRAHHCKVCRRSVPSGRLFYQRSSHTERHEKDVLQRWIIIARGP